MGNIKAKFQLLDNYVKTYFLNVNRKIQNNEDMEIDGKISFKIININKEENKRLIGEIELANEIEIIIKEEHIGKINIVMGALFEGDLEIEKDFENMLKINGATTLSHLMRAYVATNTSLSGMQTIMLPLINFIEFFKESKKENKNDN